MAEPESISCSPEDRAAMTLILSQIPRRSMIFDLEKQINESISSRPETVRRTILGQKSGRGSSSISDLIGLYSLGGSLVRHGNYGAMHEIRGNFEGEYNGKNKDVLTPEEEEFFTKVGKNIDRAGIFS